MRTKINKVFDMIILGSACVSKSLEIEPGVSRTLGTGFYMAHYFFNRKSATLQAQKINIDPNVQDVRQVWSLLDNKVLKTGIKLSLPSIRYRQKFYVKRINEEITYEYITELNSKLSINMESLTNYLSNSIKNDFRPAEGKLYCKSLDKEERKNYVKIKLLHSNEISTSLDNNKGIFSFLSCSISKKNLSRDSLIIHIHGGDFVSMSSTSHENYLRKWVNEIDVQIISIDYRLSPESPYPKALDDVYQAYCFIIKHAEQELFLKLNKIILIGDSAGGS